MIEVQLPPNQFHSVEDVARAIAAAVVGLSPNPDRELSGRELVRLAAARINWEERIATVFDRGALMGRNPLSLEHLSQAVMSVDQVVFSLDDLNACGDLRDDLLIFVAVSSRGASGPSRAGRRRWTEHEIAAARAMRDRHKSAGHRAPMAVTARFYGVTPQLLRRLFAEKPTASFAKGLGGRKS